MTTAAYSAHPVLAIIADATLPVMALLALVLPAVEWKAGRLKAPELLWISALVSIALVYIIRYASHSSGYWLWAGVRYSSHTAFAISVGVTLATILRWVFLPAVAAVVCGYLWAVAYLGYHTPGDVLSTALVILPVSLLCHSPWLRWYKRGS